MNDPIIFYDGECGLCDYAVRFLLRIDRKNIYYYAPLQGTTAKEKLVPPPDRDSLVLLESDGKLSMEGAAVLRILWILGGAWKLIGWMHVLPSLPFDWLYRILARNRHKLFGRSLFCDIPADRSRFLP